MASSSSSGHSFRRQWLVPVVLLTSVAFAIFWAFYALDVVSASKPEAMVGNGPIAHYLRFDPGSITDAVSSLAGMIAAVFGIVITVVSIIVQLSAERYTGVARMFLRDRVNLGVMAFYLVACVCGVWLSVSLHHDFVPRATLVGMLVTTTGGLVLMAPYFGYVFWFLEPNNIISRIRRDAVRVAGMGARVRDRIQCAAAQAQTLSAMEELTDITSNSISGKDKIIASGAVDALKDFAIEYVRVKPEATEVWFNIGSDIRQNPDFVAMDPESLHDLEQRRTWVEWKVMRQYLGIYNEALGSMRDICYLIAIDTRYVGEAAGEAKDEELMRLVLRFMNSYMRATLNARDVRTAYNVLEPVSFVGGGLSPTRQRRAGRGGRRAHALLRARELRHEADVRDGDRRLRRVQPVPVRSRAGAPRRAGHAGGVSGAGPSAQRAQSGKGALGRAQSSGQARGLLPHPEAAGPRRADIQRHVR